MSLYLAVLVFIFGAVIGSFLNVVIFRHEKGEKLDGFSHCPHCLKRLRAHELVPLLSFLFLRGRCAGCKERIARQYFFVEALTGFTFLALYTTLAPRVFPIFVPEDLIRLVYYAVIFSVLIVIAVYDARTKIIPDRFVWLFNALAFAGLYVDKVSYVFVIPSLLAFLAGPILFLPFYALWYVSRGRWIGLGDGKLALGIGWLLGLSMGVSAIMLSFWIGALVSLALLFGARLIAELRDQLPSQKNLRALHLFRILHKVSLRLGFSGLTMKSEIPFGPFLVLACAMVFLFHIDILLWLTTFS